MKYLISSVLKRRVIFYDLAGRRIENIVASGIYIVNGKKTLVK
jgi:hypothetical protein